MQGLFRYDGGFAKVFGKIADVVCLSLLWLLSSLPVITMGAGFCALYTTVYKVIRYDRTGLWQEYWHSFCQNFKQATVSWICLLAVYFLIGFSGLNAYAMFEQNKLPGGGSCYAGDCGCFGHYVGLLPVSLHFPFSQYLRHYNEKLYAYRFGQYHTVYRCFGVAAAGNPADAGRPDRGYVCACLLHLSKLLYFRKSISQVYDAGRYLQRGCRKQGLCR